MKKVIGFLLFAVIVQVTFAEDIMHKFLIANFMGKSLHYVDQFDPENNWTIDVGYAVFDMQMIGEKRLMINHDNGYHVYDLETRERVDTFSSDKMKKIKSMRRLEDGRTFFASQNGPVYEFDKDGEFVAEYQMPEDVKFVRMMRFTPDGNVLLACNKGGYECSLEKGLKPEERLVKKFLMPRPRNSYMALYSPDKSKVYLSGGYSKGFYTFDTDGKLLKDTVVKQPEGLHNYFYGGFQIMENGHIIMTNWTGHGERDFKPGLKLVEFDEEHDVVWSWNEAYGGTVNQVIVFE